MRKQMTPALLESGQVFETGDHWYQVRKTEDGCMYLRKTVFSIHNSDPTRCGWEYHANVEKITESYMKIYSSLCSRIVRVSIPLNRMFLVELPEPVKQ